MSSPKSINYIVSPRYKTWKGCHSSTENSSLHKTLHMGHIMLLLTTVKLLGSRSPNTFAVSSPMAINIRAHRDVSISCSSEHNNRKHLQTHRLRLTTCKSDMICKFCAFYHLFVGIPKSVSMSSATLSMSSRYIQQRFSGYEVLHQPISTEVRS